MNYPASNSAIGNADFSRNEGSISRLQNLYNPCFRELVPCDFNSFSNKNRTGPDRGLPWSELNGAIPAQSRWTHLS